MQREKSHRYLTEVEWTGNLGRGTAGYRASVLHCQLGELPGDRGSGLRSRSLTRAGPGLFDRRDGS